MKRIFALIICVVAIISVFTACNSDKTTDVQTDTSTTEANTFIGDGFKQNLTLLVESNRMFVKEVFIERSLTVDISKPKKDGMTTYYRVISDKITSCASLVDYVNSTYTKEAADNLLKDNIYKDIDGKLYSRNNYTLKNDPLESYEITIEGVSVTNDKCVFKTVNENGKELEMTAVFENGVWKLDKVYTEI